jgi:multisubunit Na+/H+ antiporter MnhE subunit
MNRIVIQTLAFMGIYLLVLTSTAPGDVLVGALVGLGLALALRPRAAGRRTTIASPAAVVALGSVVFTTAVEMARGSWRTARFCLGLGGQPGFVEIPRAGRSRHGVALWGVLTGEAPDEVPVDIDEDRDVLIVHLVDASDPDAVRDRHRRAYETAQHRVVH